MKHKTKKRGGFKVPLATLTKSSTLLSSSLNPLQAKLPVSAVTNSIVSKIPGASKIPGVPSSLNPLQAKLPVSAVTNSIVSKIPGVPSSLNPLQGKIPDMPTPSVLMKDKLAEKKAELADSAKKGASDLGKKAKEGIGSAVSKLTDMARSKAMMAVQGNPLAYLLFVIVGQGMKTSANVELFTKIMKSYNIGKNKYEKEYEKLNDFDKEDYKVATLLIKNHYHEFIGKKHQIFTSIKKMEEEYCDDVDSLDKQYTLMKSKHYKVNTDFLKVFQQNLKQGVEGKFKKLSKEIPGDQAEAHKKIEEQFIYDENGVKENLSYIIPYIIHDIYYRGKNIDKSVLDATYLHKQTCSLLLRIMSKIYSGASSTLKGGYSKRRAPKKRTPTRRKVKVIK